ncbi:hypothetical protein HDE_09641 [Halotydeus destructor]|nr:hypothetical protein HDE_09641 [Halotydeus destructor]
MYTDKIRSEFDAAFELLKKTVLGNRLRAAQLSLLEDQIRRRKLIAEMQTVKIDKIGQFISLLEPQKLEIIKLRESVALMKSECGANAEKLALEQSKTDIEREQLRKRIDEHRTLNAKYIDEVRKDGAERLREQDSTVTEYIADLNKKQATLEFDYRKQGFQIRQTLQEKQKDELDQMNSVRQNYTSKQNLVRDQISAEERLFKEQVEALTLQHQGNIKDAKRQLELSVKGRNSLENKMRKLNAAGDGKHVTQKATLRPINSNGIPLKSPAVMPLPSPLIVKPKPMAARKKLPVKSHDNVYLNFQRDM